MTRRRPLLGAPQRVHEQMRSRRPEAAIEPFEVPWLPADLTENYDWSPAINTLAFHEAVHRAGGWDRLPARLPEVMAAGKRANGWLQPWRPPIAAGPLATLRTAVRQELARRGHDSAVEPLWPAREVEARRTHLAVFAFVRYRERMRQHGMCAAALVPGLMAGLRGLVWGLDEQVRSVEVRAELARRPWSSDIWSIRVEECYAREWPDWAFRAPADALIAEGPPAPGEPRG